MSVDHVWPKPQCPVPAQGFVSKFNTRVTNPISAWHQGHRTVDLVSKFVPSASREVPSDFKVDPRIVQ
jgi:hypothetical protein